MRACELSNASFHYRWILKTKLCFGGVAEAMIKAVVTALFSQFHAIVATKENQELYDISKDVSPVA